ncbi:MAG: GNAT family N-acetyltransferase, partial [Dehalococcoidia bacterium]
DGWTRDIEAGTVTTVLAATPDGVVLGYATLDRGDLRWTRHVAEIRVLVDAAARDRGLGRMLLQIAFDMALAAGVEKVMARMTPDQVSARALFEGLGFESEAVLRNHVRDAQGRKHDLVVLSFDTERQDLAPCDVCGGLAITRLSLEGSQLCWSCYELAASEIGGG